MHVASDQSDRARRSVRAFTLVELLVVIAIIAVLIAFLLPALNRARAAASKVACQSGMRQIFIAATMYANEYRDFYPLYNFSNGASASGYDVNAPWYSYWLLDKYTRVKYDNSPSVTVTSPGKLDYDLYGPTSRNIYFCDEFRSVHVRSAGNPYGFGYAVNTYYTGDFRPWNVPIMAPGTRRTRIPRSSQTVYMNEINVPYTYDANMGGPELWAMNPVSHAISIYSLSNYSLLHSGGHNVLYFDGHVQYYKFPASVEGELWPGYNSETFWTAMPSVWP